MPELTPSTRELARRIGVTEAALRKAEQKQRIAREPDGQWDVEKTRQRMVETADPVRSPLAAPGAAAEGTPYGRLKIAQLALQVESQRLALDEEKGRLLDVHAANAAIDEIAGAMRDALLNWPARVRAALPRPAWRRTRRSWQRSRSPPSLVRHRYRGRQLKMAASAPLSRRVRACLSEFF